MHTVGILVKKNIWLQEIETSQAHRNEEEIILRVQGHLAGPEQEVQQASHRQQGSICNQVTSLHHHLSPWGSSTSRCCCTTDSFWSLRRSVKNAASAPWPTWLSAHCLSLPIPKYTHSWRIGWAPQGLTSCCFGGRVVRALGPLLWVLGAEKK